VNYHVRHRTTYRYLQEVSHSCHLAHLVPRQTATQRLTDTNVILSLPASRRLRRTDYFGNTAEWFFIDQPHETLEVLSQSRVQVSARPALDGAAGRPWDEVRQEIETSRDTGSRQAIGFLFESPRVTLNGKFADYAVECFPQAESILTGACALMHRIHEEFSYDSTVTDAATPVERVFEIRAGVCQDLAHVAIACLRSLGLPARYVSGYLLTQPPPGQPRLIGADASHAWFAVWAPPFGWVDLDPTNDILPGDGHITLAWGRDYSDVAPITGIVSSGGEHVIEVGVDVVPE
jgi:transglutaminase-like putative cysteine protease